MGAQPREELNVSREIQLTQGKVAIVDDEDYAALSKYKWFAVKNKNRFYAARKHLTLSGSRNLFMHLVIANTPKGFQTDHRNGDSLDNRRSNLRTCTQVQNQHNVGRRADNTSGYKGVSWVPRERKWLATIQNNGKRIYIGRFNTADEAGRAYDDKAQELHGEFARTNF